MSTSPPSLDISVRWKLLAAFGGTFLLPVVLILAHVELWLIVLVGLPAAFGLALYSSWRIIHTVSRIASVVDRLGHRADTPLPDHTIYNDELTNLVRGFDHLLENLESSYEDEPPPLPLVDDTDITQTQYTHRIYQGTLSTGDSVTGDVALLPRRVEEDLLRVAQVTGDTALTLFTDIVTIAREQLADLIETSGVGDDQKGIIEFQVLLLDDPNFTSGMKSCLSDENLTLADSLTSTFGSICSKLEGSQNPYIRARVPDCLDLKQRLLDVLFHSTNPGLTNLYSGLAGKIVVCHQIFPSDVITLRNAGVRGIISQLGTASSHAEIFLQSFNLPSISNVPGLPVERLKGHSLLLDTRYKRVVVSPTQKEQESVRDMQLADTLAIIQPAITLESGEPMRVDVTVNNVDVEAEQAARYGADGVGLFRSEMSYIGRVDLPHEEELYAEYKRLVDQFRGRPIILRMLDLGSDKLAMFQQKPREENPCMGNRSMRLLLREPVIFRHQMRAMLRAATPETSIIYPMIGGWAELLQIQQRMDQVKHDLRQERVAFCEHVRVGLMVEIPGLVTRFEDYVEHFDSFNIGSNDLTQYTLAADRNNEAVADYFRFHHPAVLSMIAKVCRLGREHGKDVRLCGEMGSDPELLPLLVGLGVTAWSVPYRHIPMVKANLSRLRLDPCTALADQALKARTPQEVERLLADFRKTQLYHAQRTTTLVRETLRPH